MSTQVKQVVFVGLAAVLVLFMVWMLKSQPASPVPASSVGNAPAPARSSGAAPEKSAVDPAVMQRLAALQEKIDKDPKDVKSLTEMGDTMFELKQFARAADAYITVLEIEPKNAAARVKLGNSYFYQGMSRPAVREYNAVIEGEPKNAEAHYYLALVLSHGNPPDLDGALKSWQEVIKLAPGTDLATNSQKFIDAYKSPSK